MNFEHLAAAERVSEIARAHAERVDTEGAFPKDAIDAARKHGLFALLSSKEVGGHGLGMRQAAEVIERLARECGSTAMVLSMHYSGTAVIEAHGSLETRRAIARGEHLTTLAFSESGSRSHFWAPTGTARVEGGEIVLDANKSWITSAGHADSFVWSSRPAAADGLSTLWLVPRTTRGLRATARFDGIGLRGNDSAPMTAEAARISAKERLGDDGAGFAVMMQTVLPLFSVLISSGSIGMMEAAVTKTAEHAAATRHVHLDSALREMPTIRAYIAKMRIQTDMARALWLDTLTALEGARGDAMLRVLEVKAATAEAAREVLDTAMRVCAGAAFRREVGVERRFRDSRAALIMAPTTDQLYDFIGKAVCGLPLF